MRIASTEGYASEFVPAAIAQFRQQFSGIRFSLDVCSQQEIPQRIRDGSADIGVTLSLTSQRDIRVEVRVPAPVRAILAADHPLAGRRDVALPQLIAYPLALPSPDSTLRQLIDISCSRQQLHCEPAFTSRSIDALVGFASAGGGVAFCGELAIRHRLRWGRIVAVPLRDREMNERHFEVQTLAGRIMPDAAKAFIASLAEAAL